MLIFSQWRRNLPDTYSVCMSTVTQTDALLGLNYEITGEKLCRPARKLRPVSRIYSLAMISSGCISKLL